jgi:hypothetical protein
MPKITTACRGVFGIRWNAALGHFPQVMEIFYQRQLFCLTGLRSKKIPSNLKIQPKICGDPEKLRQSKRGTWSDTPLLINELIYSLIWHMNGIGQIALTDIHRHEELLPKHLAGMGRRSVRWNSNHIQYL